MKNYISGNGLRDVKTECLVFSKIFLYIMVLYLIYVWKNQLSFLDLKLKILIDLTVHLIEKIIFGKISYWVFWMLDSYYYIVIFLFI